ncbi:tyrosine-type recombinase/integrase [Aeromonas veronii]|uniref:tyrosine-type recombinase/integrase n=1 Tax=Aeromonas veronii TaxID=654 RepID=UPI001F21CAE4|nr:tyrosine-type recombinase/integrase [Aeromonas veronii]MCF5860057.1 tyrosine-type recombinase/integrase [Aeromonas veronii]
MYKVMKIDDDRACLIDSEVMQPTFLSLKFCIELLHQKSVNYQILTLTNIMYFKEYWLAKFGCTLDYSMYKGQYSGSVISRMITELDGFWIFLGNARVYTNNVLFLPESHQNDSIQKMKTRASRYHTVCRFISWLIDTYITAHHITESLMEIDAHRKMLHSMLSLEARKYSRYTSQNRHSSNMYKSLTMEQLRDFASLFTLPTIIEKDDDGKLLPSVYTSFRNLILVKLLTQYGLRIGEALLLRGTSFKSNMAGTAFYMYVDSLNDGVDPRKHKPLIKTRQSIRELKITAQDYKIITAFMAQVEMRSSHDFLITSSIGDCPPLSYKAAYKIITDVSDAMKDKFPEHFSPRNAECLENVHPHMLRHTWAYMQLKSLHQHFERKFAKAGAVNIKGIMESAKDTLRKLGGWAEGSSMPSRYAERFIAEHANEISMEMFEDSTFNVFAVKELPNF